MIWSRLLKIIGCQHRTSLTYVRWPCINTHKLKTSWLLMYSNSGSWKWGKKKYYFYYKNLCNVLILCLEQTLVKVIIISNIISEGKEMSSKRKCHWAAFSHERQWVCTNLIFDRDFVDFFKGIVFTKNNILSSFTQSHSKLVWLQYFCRTHTHK